MTSVAIAEPGRGGEVPFLGEIPSSPEALHRLVTKPARAATASIGCCVVLTRTASSSHRR
jgi:hypothetical protein